MITDSGFAYRLPGDHRVIARIGKVRKGFHDERSFIIAPFANPAGNIISITESSDISLDGLSDIILNFNSDKEWFPLNHSGTSRSQHYDAVTEIVKAIWGDINRKTIAARLLCGKGQINPLESFRTLCDAFPDAFVFMFFTPQSGCWIGASPELLLAAEEGTLSTCALAGTRPAGTSGDWDEKNLNEQKIVRNFISDIFVKWNMIPAVSPLSSRRAGNVEHLFSYFTHPASREFREDPVSFLSDLSPTPALCGFPRGFSMTLIEDTEIAPRGFYGGFAGWIENIDNFRLYVNLRSVKFNQEGWNMFAGGGITKDSDPEEEWIETERKSKGILENLKFL